MHNYKLPSHWISSLTVDEVLHYLSAGLIDGTDYSNYNEAIAHETTKLRNQLSCAEDNLCDMEREKDSLIEDLREQLSAYER